MDVQTHITKAQAKALKEAGAYLSAMRRCGKKANRITLFQEMFDDIREAVAKGAKKQKRPVPDILTYRGVPLHRGEPK